MCLIAHSSFGQPKYNTGTHPVYIQQDQITFYVIYTYLHGGRDGGACVSKSLCPRTAHLMSTEILSQAFGAATSKALSEETSLVLGTLSFCLPPGRSEARPGI